MSAHSVVRDLKFYTVSCTRVGPNLIFSRILLLSRAIFPPLFFVTVTFVIVRFSAKKNRN